MFTQTQQRNIVILAIGIIIYSSIAFGILSTGSFTRKQASVTVADSIATFQTLNATNGSYPLSISGNISGPNATHGTPLAVLTRETLYLMNSTNITAGSATTLRIVPNSEVTPIRTAYILVLENDRERQFLFPVAVYADDIVEFSFNMFVSGTFKVTLFAEGLFKHNDLPWELPNFDKKHYFDMPNLEKVYDFEAEIIEPSPFSSAHERLAKHLSTLPKCSPTTMDNFQQGGRYLVGTLFPTLEDGGGVGAHLTYLPPNCKLHYFSSAEANTCLQTRNVTLIGDSTTRETTQEMILHLTAQLFDRQLPENVYDCLPGWEHCYKSREFGYSVPTPSGKPKSWINHIWGATKYPCDNGNGAIDLKNDHTFLDFTKFKISYPEFCHGFNTTMGFPAKEWGAKGGQWESKVLKVQDVLIYSSGQHDMHGIARYPDVDYHLYEYEERIDFVMSQLAPLATTRVFVATYPQVGRHNFMNRHINSVARRVAKKNGFLFVDQNGSMIHRLTGAGYGLTGDWVHAYPRTIFTATNIQLLLNAICPK